MLLSQSHSADPGIQKIELGVLELINAQVTVLDSSGRIMAVNQTRQDFFQPTGHGDDATGMGLLYLDICTSGINTESGNAEALSQELQLVLQGRRSHCQLDYSHQKGEEKYWFHLHISLPGYG